MSSSASGASCDPSRRRWDEAADAVHAAGALLDRRRCPRDPVVHHAPAERVQVFAFLQHVGGDQHQRKARHAELAHQALVDAARHPADRNLFLQRGGVEPGEIGQRAGQRVGEIDRHDVVERLGGLGKFAKRVQSRRVSLASEQRDKIDRQFGR